MSIGALTSQWFVCSSSQSRPYLIILPSCHLWKNTNKVFHLFDKSDSLYHSIYFIAIIPFMTSCPVDLTSSSSQVKKDFPAVSSESAPLQSDLSPSRPAIKAGGKTSFLHQLFLLGVWIVLSSRDYLIIKQFNLIISHFRKADFLLPSKCWFGFTMDLSDWCFSSRSSFWIGNLLFLPSPSSSFPSMHCFIFWPEVMFVFGAAKSMHIITKN